MRTRQVHFVSVDTRGRLERGYWCQKGFLSESELEFRRICGHKKVLELIRNICPLGYFYLIRKTKGKNKMHSLTLLLFIYL